MLEPRIQESAPVQLKAAELIKLQRAEEAEALIRDGLKAQPQHTELRELLPFAILMQGRFRDGFREFEGRRTRRNALPRQLPYPEWDGPIAGKSILVWGEQGLGDEIQMARYLRRLRELGASRITLACLPQAVRALRQAGADQVISREGDIVVPKHDCWTMIWSIPHRLGLRLQDITGEPYLTATPRGPGGVGLVETGNPANPVDADRSLPAGLLQAAIPEGRLIEAEGDIHDSLCRLAALDLLITVDTSWAHMAGALGVPCWLLLPYRNLDWRWLRERRETPWYASMRLFRQPAPGAWEPVLAEVRRALAQR